MSITSATRWMQVELMGQCPPIEKMDATLSTLKACVCVSGLGTFVRTCGGQDHGSIKALNPISSWLPMQTSCPVHKQY
jgi:hypothetical protein